jgi:Ca2+-binding RTX toxin-like protein
MQNDIRPDASGAVRPARLLASAVAVALVTGVAGFVAGTADAATSTNEANASAHQKKVKRPKVKHGVLTIEGTNAGEAIALRLKAGDPEVLQVDVRDDGSAEFDVKLKHVTSIDVDARNGDDQVRVDEGNGAFTDRFPTEIDGDDGNDTLAGGTGAERLLGGDGNDSIDGNRGNDTALMGDGDDTFIWDPGDGSDVVEGEGGADTMRFNGANVAEEFDLSANGNRLRFFRNVGTITMDTNDVETVDLRALGGADIVTVGDLTGTDVTTVRSDLAATLDGNTGDGQPDEVIVTGTNGDDVAVVSGSGGAANVIGLAASVHVRNAEPADDTLTVDLLAGDDVGEASALASSSVELTMDAGAGDDVLIGSAGDDTLFGRDGDDTLIGGPGLDVLDGGNGNNVVIQD